MDFLVAMGTQIQSGEATLKVKLSPSAEDPRLRPSKVNRMSSEDTSPEVLEGRSTTVLGKQESDDKDTMYTEQSEVPAYNRIMRQMTPSGERKNDHGGDEIRRYDEPGRALGDFRPDEIDEAGDGELMTEEDDLRPDQREFITRELTLFKELQGVSHVAEHRIIMRDDKPLKQRYYPRNPAMQSEIDAQVNELLREDAIEPSRSPHSAPIVLIKKKTGKWRMCVDYRLNAHSVPDAYIVPRINHILEKLRQAPHTSTRLLANTQAKDSRQFTAFTVSAYTSGRSCPSDFTRPAQPPSAPWIA